MRVGLFIPDFNGGGAERAALLLARHWPEPGGAVLVVRAESGPLASLACGLPVASLRLPRAGAVATAGTVPRLWRVARTNGLDVVVAFLSLPSALAAASWRRPFGVAWWIQSPSGKSVARTESGIAARYSAVARGRLLSAAARRADGVIAASNGLLSASLGGRTLADRHVVIPNPIDPSFGEMTRSPRHGAALTIVAAGRLVREKRFDVLVRAFQVVRRRRPARLVIYGDGPLRSELSVLAQTLGVDRDVAFPGFVLDQREIYWDADVFVSSSDYEGFGNTLAEALAAGLPVVSTDAPFGPRDILDGGRFGVLTPPGNAVALAEAIVSAAPGGSCHERLVVSARSRGARYTATRVAAEVEQYLRSLTAGHAVIGEPGSRR